MPILTTGLIPAHAGKTDVGDGVHCLSPAHPRSRGENNLGASPGHCSCGSSPLTRGKRCPAASRSAARGLIPAHAGKTRRGWRAGARPGAHPRSRGENRGHTPPACPLAGSSPLTRGKLNRTVGMRGRVGLIPAHAGKTLPDLRFYCADRSDLGNP